jgi:hypothetical protein
MKNIVINGFSIYDRRKANERVSENEAKNFARLLKYEGI